MLISAKQSPLLARLISELGGRKGCCCGGTLCNNSCFYLRSSLGAAGCQFSVDFGPQISFDFSGNWSQSRFVNEPGDVLAELTSDGVFSFQGTLSIVDTTNYGGALEYIPGVGYQMYTGSAMIHNNDGTQCRVYLAEDFVYAVSGSGYGGIANGSWDVTHNNADALNIFKTTNSWDFPLLKWMIGQISTGSVWPYNYLFGSIGGTVTALHSGAWVTNTTEWRLGAACSGSYASSFNLCDGGPETQVATSSNSVDNMSALLDFESTYHYAANVSPHGCKPRGSTIVGQLTYNVLTKGSCP